MKERGIIFSGPMVRANLEGRKTQTRRTRGLNRINENPDRWVLLHNMSQNANNVWVNRVWFQEKKERVPVRYPVSCPYGVVGDRFYMRETFTLDMRETFTLGTATGCPGFIPLIYVIYKADETLKIFKLDDVPKKCSMTFKSHPSIHMPKKFARPERFEITDIRVERVQDISAEDAIAEGMLSEGTDLNNGKCADNPYEQFAQLWDSINAKRGYGWESNPWVWVISYRKL